MLRAGFCSIIILLIVQAAWAGDAKRILIVGDSLTAGYGVEKSAAYPAQLQKLFEKEWPKSSVEVINAGSSGSTSASAVNRLKWHLRKKPTHLILALGANDGLRGIKTESTKKNLEAAIDLALKNQIKVYLAGMKLPMNYGEEYRKDFEKIFTDLAKEKKIKAIPFLLKGVGADPKLNLSDGIHPNEEGHKVIARTVFDILKESL